MTFFFLIISVDVLVRFACECIVYRIDRSQVVKQLSFSSCAGLRAIWLMYGSGLYL